MRIARADLNLDRLFVVYSGDQGYPLADSIEVVPLAEFVTMDREIRLLSRRRG
jgi:hypothetical protein